MNSFNSTISNHQKGQHLAFQDSVIIQVLRKRGSVFTPNCRQSQLFMTTVKYELECGQITLYHGWRHRYDAQVAQSRYRTMRTPTLLVIKAGLSDITT